MTGRASSIAITILTASTLAHADVLRAQAIRREGTIAVDVDVLADLVAVGIDSYNDRRTAYVFQLNAAGVQRDQIVFDDSKSDDSWDAVWTGDAALTESGWTAEFRIPLNQLRFTSRDVQTVVMVKANYWLGL